MVPLFCDLKIFQRHFKAKTSNHTGFLLKYKKISYYNRWRIVSFHIENNPNTFKKDVVEPTSYWQCHSLLLRLSVSHINTLCKYKHQCTCIKIKNKIIKWLQPPLTILKVTRFIFILLNTYNKKYNSIKVLFHCQHPILWYNHT